jgi:hypothetical protein
MGAVVDAQLGAADTLLVGHTAYDGFAEAWPGREDADGEDAGLAKKLGDARKVVVSNQEPEFSWRNSEQLEGDLVDAELVGFLTYLFGEALENNPYVTGGDQRALGRPPRDFADYAAETAATGVWTRTDQSSPGSPR